MKTLTNKLSIYLIKEGLSEPKEILKNIDELSAVDIPNVGTFYYGESFVFPPSWKEKFFGTTLGDEVKLKNASSKAVFLTSIVRDNKTYTFVLAFGYGRQYLIHGVCEERFGLKTVLNIVDPEKLRKIDKKNMSAAPKDSSEQLSQSGVAADFGIDIEQDLVRSVTGLTKDSKKFGKSATGKDALTVSVKVDINSVKLFLADCLEQYQSDGYKKDFDWIDQIADVRDPRTLDKLNAALLENIKNHILDKTWMAVPEIVEWETLSGFRYTGKSRGFKDDLYLPDFLDSLSAGEVAALDVDLLKGKSIQAMSSVNDEVKHQWSAYNCIYSEQQDTAKNKTYLLSNGRWYEIASDFALEVNQDFAQLRDTSAQLVLPDCHNEKEGDYNTRVATESSWCLMDKKMISHGGSYSKIEFCDLLTADKKIIHVKHYAGSSVLSHLFSQGLVSGELFLRDRKFRDKVNAKLEDGFKLQDVANKPEAKDYRVVFAIISSSKKSLDIPFFSKVSLRNAKNRLETFGYTVSLIKINATSP